MWSVTGLSLVNAITDLRKACDNAVIGTNCRHGVVGLTVLHTVDPLLPPQYKVYLVLGMFRVFVRP